MGEPRPGQFPDNIFTSVQQIKMGTNVVANAGDWIIRSSTPAQLWLLADATSDAVDLSARGLVQTRVDIDTTGLAAGVVSVEASEAPSYVYAIAGGALPAGCKVKLGTTGQKFIVANAADLAAGLVVGRFSRLKGDSAGNNDAVDLDVIILKMGVI